MVRGAHHERPMLVLRLRGLPLLQRRVCCLRRAAGAAAVGSLSVASTASRVAQPTAADSATAAAASARVVHAGMHVGMGAVWPCSDDTPYRRHREAQAVATWCHAVARLWLSQG